MCIPHWLGMVEIYRENKLQEERNDWEQNYRQIGITADAFYMRRPVSNYPCSIIICCEITTRIVCSQTKWIRVEEKNLHTGSWRSMKQASASSQWKAPSCVPMVLCERFCGVMLHRIGRHFKKLFKGRFCLHTLYGSSTAPLTRPVLRSILSMQICVKQLWVGFDGFHSRRWIRLGSWASSVHLGREAVRLTSYQEKLMIFYDDFSVLHKINE